MTAAGSVSDYDTTSQASLIEAFAATVVVPAADVSLSVTAASVILVFSVRVDNATEAIAVTEAADTSLPTAAAATAALGVTVVTAPVSLVIVVPDESPSAPPTPPPVTSPLVENEENVATDDLGAGEISAIVLLPILAVCGAGAALLLRKKRLAKQQSDLRDEGETKRKSGGGGLATSNVVVQVNKEELVAPAPQQGAPTKKDETVETQEGVRRHRV